MKQSLWKSLGLGVSMAWLGALGVQAQEARPYQIYNRLRVEYDDNIYQRSSDKTGSVKLVDALEFWYNINRENTFLSLRYRPTFIYWDKREPDNTDLQHEADLVWNQTFSPRLSLGVVDNFRYGRMPELRDQNVVVQQNSDYYYNALNGTLSYLLRPGTRLDVTGRQLFLRYDADAVASNQDYDVYIGGVTLRQDVGAKTVVLGELRAEHLSYSGVDRGSDTLYAGGGVEQIFNPSLVGSLRGGYSRRTFTDSDLGSSSAPYGDASLTYLLSPATRLGLGALYQMDKTDLATFASQDRMQVYVNAAYDVTARVSLYAAGSYSRGNFKADQAVAPDAVDGHEDTYVFSTLASYKINRSNWLELGWQLVDLSSDYREKFLENNYNLSWKTQF